MCLQLPDIGSNIELTEVTPVTRFLFYRDTAIVAQIAFIGFELQESGSADAS